MQKLSRREALRGTGVAALAAGAAVGVPFGAIARPSVEDQVLSLAPSLLNDKGGTCGEWVERKRIARFLQALVTDDVTPWEQWELNVQEESRRLCAAAKAAMAEVRS